MWKVDIHLKHFLSSNMGRREPDLMSTPLSLRKEVNRKGFLMIPHLSQNALNNRVLMIFFILGILPGVEVENHASNSYLSNGIILVPLEGSIIVFFNQYFAKSFCCPHHQIVGGPPDPTREARLRDLHGWNPVHWGLCWIHFVSYDSAIMFPETRT